VALMMPLFLPHAYLHLTVRVLRSSAIVPTIPTQRHPHNVRPQTSRPRARHGRASLHSCGLMVASPKYAKSCSPVDLSARRCFQFPYSSSYAASPETATEKPEWDFRTKTGKRRSLRVSALSTRAWNFRRTGGDMNRASLPADREEQAKMAFAAPTRVVFAPCSAAMACMRPAVCRAKRVQDRLHLQPRCSAPGQWQVSLVLSQSDLEAGSRRLALCLTARVSAAQATRPRPGDLRASFLRALAQTSTA
jgi:hypothetical protein